MPDPNEELNKDILEQLDEGSASTEEPSEGSDAQTSEESFIEIDGETFASEDDLRKAFRDMKGGAMMRDNYTRKTQKLSKERKELEAAQAKLQEDENLRGAEREELEYWRRVDQAISNDPAKLAAFKQLWGNSQTQEYPAAQVEAQIPEEIMSKLERIDEFEDYLEDKRIDTEMGEVDKFVGGMTEQERSEFLEYAMEKQEQYDKAIPLMDVADRFFRDKLVSKELARRQKESKERNSDKAKTKGVGAGKPATSMRKPGEVTTAEEFKADIAKYLGG